MATAKKKKKKKIRRPVILDPINPPDSFTLAELRHAIAKVAAAPAKFEAAGGQ